MVPTRAPTSPLVAVDAHEILRLLYRQLRSLAGPREDLDDIVQAAAERALKSLPNFEGRSELSTWTYGVAYRTLLDHDRWFARWRRRFNLVDQIPEPAPPRGATPEDSEAALLQLRRAQSLYRALDGLTTLKRAVIVFHDLEGLTINDIARITGVNERTLRTRLRDARLRLAELLRVDPLFDPRIDDGGPSGETPLSDGADSEHTTPTEEVRS